MLQKKYFIILAAVLLVLLDNPNILYGYQNLSYEKLGSSSFEKKNIKTAIKEFEKQHSEKIHLPQMDAFNASVIYGQYFSDIDSIKLYWGTNTKSFQFNITSIPNNQHFKQNIVYLKNGIKAYYIQSPNNYGLEFTKGGLHYYFVTYKNKSIPINVIKRLAESL